MKEAMFYKKLGNSVQCCLCPHNCMIMPGKRGICRARENKDGKLISLIYGKIVSAAIDPIEKKPLYHFLPGSKTYSIAAAGCNFRCLFCQNWEISQIKPEESSSRQFTPEDIVEKVKEADCESISYTYTEPTINYEFVIETAKLARENGLKNVIVTNGYINPEPLKKLCEYVDAANVDIKSFNEEFYNRICGGELKYVLDALKIMKSLGVHIETTTLLIPGQNGKISEIKKMCKWIFDELGENTPVHFSRAFPMYKMNNIEITPLKILEKAHDVAKKIRLKNVYVGNV